MPPHRPRSHVVVGIALALVLASCAHTGGSPPARVVATTTILGDVAAEVVGTCGVTVETLVPPGQDPHGYRPSARATSTVLAADLVLANGLGLEEGLTDLLESATAAGVSVLRLGPLLDPMRLPGTDRPDPHVWFDPVRMAHGVDLLVAALVDALPDAATCLSGRGQEYRAEILATDERIRARLAGVPPARRLLVTNHEALGYFADRYGFTVVGAVVPGGSPLAEPSPSDVAALVAALDRTGLDVVFVENTEPTRLAEAVAAETGHPVRIVELFTGSLGPPGSGAETYVGLLETDADRIATALGG